MRVFMRIVHLFMLALFVAWAAFQWNDPDGLVWVAVYGIAAIECLLFLMGRFPKSLGVAYVILCAIWAVILAVGLILDGEFIFDERGREMFGLLFCGGWTFMLGRWSRK